MAVARVVLGLTLASSAATDLDPDLRAEDTSQWPLILAHVVSGSEGGLADGMYVVYDCSSRDEQGEQSLKGSPLCA